MRVEGQHPFLASRAGVWQVLTDPAALGRSIPGCKALTTVCEGEFAVDLELGIATIRGKYGGLVRIMDPVEPVQYRLAIELKGSSGWLKGAWDLHLAPSADGTLLTYGGDAQVGGLVAGVGQRVLLGVTKLVIRQMFTALGREVTGT